MSELKKVIRSEYLKCAKDPFHFMRKYCYIQHPQRGRIQFNLYPFQEKVLTLMRDNPYSIILKSRQLGISTLTAGYSLWLMTFHKDKNILCIATKQETAKNMVTKVKFMYDNLPSWLKIDSTEYNKLTLRLTNGSQIKATSASSDAGRSEAVSLLLVDEAAFIDNIEEIWISAQSTLSTGGNSIILSTPNGVGNFFHRTWVGSEEDENGFNPIVLIPKNGAAPHEDTCLSGTAHRQSGVIRVPIIEPLRWARRLGFSNTKEYAKGLLPDRPKGWIQKLLLIVKI